MVRAMPDHTHPRLRARMLVAMVSVLVIASLAGIDPDLRAALLPDRQAAGLIGTAVAFALALLLGDVLHTGSIRRQHKKG